MGVVWDGSRWAGFGVGQGGCGWVKGQDGRGGVGQGGQIWWCEALVGGGWGWVGVGGDNVVKNGPGSHNSISFFSSIDIAMSLLMESNQRHYLSTILSCHETLCQDHTTGK